MEVQTGIAEVMEETSGETVTFPTVRFGEVTISKERVLSFPRGIVGLPSAQNFVFLHLEETQGPFFWLQCIDDPTLAFVVCEPQHFFPEYSVPLGTEEQSLLDLTNEGVGLVCVILVVPDDPRHITANLRGPLVINTERRVGFQFVLDDDYSVKQPLFTNPNEGGAACSS